MNRLFYIALTYLALSAPVKAQEYLWPTDASYFLSATFGETRAAHFHAGLDIKTWGQEGFRVFATRDGIIHRLQVTERGYGNAIYMKHDDGSFSVYAHLQRFRNDLQAYTDSVRLIDYSFETELYLDSLNWQIKQGQVIGYTGSTGVGPPHLHFELRDSLEKPFNVLFTNITVPDNITPIITSLIVEPINKNSRINGKAYAQTIAARRTGAGQYDFGAIEISGKAGIAVNVYDMADEVFNKYAVFTLSLIQDGDTLFHQELDTFSYEQAGSNMFLDRITPFKFSSRGHQRLYSKDGSSISFHKISGSQSLIEASEEAKSYQIIASDYFGNTSTASFTISRSENISNKKPDLLLPLSDWYWHEDWASPDLEHTVDLEKLTIGFNWSKNQKLIFFDEDRPHVFARLYPDSLQKIIHPDRNLLLRFGSASIFDTLTIAAFHQMEDELIKISIQPGMLQPKSEYKLEFYIEDEFNFDENGKYNLYRVNSRGQLRFAKSRQIGRTVHAWPSDFGEFIIASDLEPPQISNFRIIRTNYNHWQAVVDVSDPLSGIDSGSAEFWVNDVRGIPVYDYEQKTLTYHLPGFKPAAKNTARISLSDRAGNVQIKQFEK